MDTKMASGAADIVIVAFHWGGEKLEQPRQYQREFARLAIDNGADIVLGHHPHVLQGIEHYKGGIIFYSLGNFAFGSYSPSAKESIIAKIALDEKGVSSIEAIPINVDNFEVHFRPEALDGERGTAVISKLSRLSEQLGTRLSFKDGRGKALKIEKTTMR
jgi:poly-gamma-glutamate capsule biosynthesis protein CapA/YwtB (metallophosphatase superfamily)